MSFELKVNLNPILFTPVVSILKQGFVKITGDITLDDTNKELFEQKGKSYLYAIDSGAIEMNANTIILLAD